MTETEFPLPPGISVSRRGLHEVRVHIDHLIAKLIWGGEPRLVRHWQAELDHFKELEKYIEDKLIWG